VGVFENTSLAPENFFSAGAVSFSGMSSSSFSPRLLLWDFLFLVENRTPLGAYVSLSLSDFLGLSLLEVRKTTFLPDRRRFGIVTEELPKRSSLDPSSSLDQNAERRISGRFVERVDRRIGRISDSPVSEEEDDPSSSPSEVEGCEGLTVRRRDRRPLRVALVLLGPTTLSSSSEKTRFSELRKPSYLCILC
jgi:hypothetical protein